MLCHDIHRDLRKIKIRSDACRRRNSGFSENFTDHGDCQLVSSHVVRSQIGGDVQKAFVDAVNDDVVGADIFHVNGNNFRADLLIKLHPGRSDIIRKLQSGIGGESGSARGRPAEMVSVILGRSLHQPEPDRLPKTLGIDLFDFLHDFKESCPSGNPVRFQGRGYSQTDRFFGPAGIGDDQICGQRIEAAVGAFCGGVE